jgi:acetyl-CoA C-acetyltransferase
MIAGGVESMSRAPLVLAKAEAPFAREQKMFDSTLGARFPNPAFVAKFAGDTMAETAANVAREHGISREESDQFALRSQQRYAAAAADGLFKEEIVEVTVAGRAGPTTVSATSIRGRIPALRPSPSCARSGPTASSPPAIRRASTTAPPRC